MKRLLTLLHTFALFGITNIALAQSGDGLGSRSVGGDGLSGARNSGGGDGLNNYLLSDSLIGLLQDILGVIMVFAVPIIVFFIIYAGFLYVTAQGSPEKIGTAHRALLYSVVGGLIILGAWVILEVIQGTIAAF